MPTIPEKEQRRTELSLVRVHPALASIVQKAMVTCPQPFTVFEGIRTKERQLALMSMGASKTLQSKHITGEAVDLVPLVDGKLSWTWEHIYPIAESMRQASRELFPGGLGIRWGGCWDAQFDASTSAPVDMVAGYTQRRKDAGKPAFLDGPHFELVDASHAH